MYNTTWLSMASAIIIAEMANRPIIAVANSMSANLAYLA